MAIGPQDWAPPRSGPGIRIVRFTDSLLREATETHVIEGVSVKVFGVAKTVADCFKYRNKIGLDVALAALRESWKAKRVTMDELWRYARLCRVANVMRPYLESLT